MKEGRLFKIPVQKFINRYQKNIFLKAVSVKSE